MALDPEYRWTVEVGVQGADGKPKRPGIGVGIENNRVVVNTNGYASLDPDAADVLELTVKTANAIVRQRKRRS